MEKILETFFPAQPINQEKSPGGMIQFVNLGVNLQMDFMKNK